MFVGTHEIQLDDKNRLRIPSRFRKELGSKFFVCQGLDKCLYLMTPDEFEVFSKPYTMIPQQLDKGRALQRALFATVEEVEEDNQGRFVLHQKYKALAGIERNIKLVGMGSHIEIWGDEPAQSVDMFKEGSLGRMLDEVYPKDAQEEILAAIRQAIQPKTEC